MKKTSVYLAILLALTLTFFVSVLIGQEPVKLELKKKTIQPKKIERVKPSFEKKTLLAPSRMKFGEPNNTSSSARLLKGFGRTVIFAAGFSNSNDMDYYKIKASSKGFGTWFKIEVQSVEPDTFNCFVELFDPAGKVVTSEYVSSGSFWIALKSGVETTFKIAPGDAIESGAQIYYNIAMTKGIIADALENDDTKAAATVLNFGDTKKAYMCGVLDGAGQTVGLSDWFKYTHRSCRNDCVYITKKAYLELCGSPNVDDCSGCSNEGTRVCVSDGCEGDGWGTSSGIRYIHVRHLDYEPNPYGQGNVPDYYITPYTIRLTDVGPATFDDDCHQ